MFFLLLVFVVINTFCLGVSYVGHNCLGVALNAFAVAWNIQYVIRRISDGQE